MSTEIRKSHDADLYNHIVNKYESDKHKPEACSYLIEKVVRENGSDKFMNADFSGIEEIANFARAIQKFLRDGKREETGNQPQRVEADEKAVQDVQNNPNGRRSQDGEVFRQVIRPKNETEDIWKDGSLGLQERITAAATRLAANHTDNKTLRNDAMRAIGGNLSDLRKAMSLQRQFDITTVKRVADLARVLMDGGYLSGLNQQEVKRLLAAVKNSTGHSNIEGDVRKVMDIMVENQLRNAEGALHSLESIKGTKVDARGVEVQGQLDAEGAHVMKVFKKARG